MPGPNIKSHVFSVTGAVNSRGTLYPATGDFIFVYASAKPFELSFDGIDFFPMREGMVIQTRYVFSTVYIRSEHDVEGTFITGYGGVLNFSASGSGGGAAGPTIAQPFESYAALGNAETVPLQTGALATIVTNGLAETWQLRVYTGGGTPVTDTGEGIVVPADYSAANNRVWFRS
jgi:hypothetical protein